MNRLFISMIGLAISAITIGQNSTIPPSQDSIVPPEFLVEEAIWAGDEVESLEDFLLKAVQYPETVLGEEHMGTAVVDFVVTSEGKLTKFRTINSISREVDNEMIRVLEETEGLWKPGLINGKPAPLKKEVNLVFAPGTNYDIVEIAMEAYNKGNEEMFVHNNPKKALVQYNKAVKMLPYNRDLLSVRSFCRYETGDNKGARKDWERVFHLELGARDQLNTGILIKHTKTPEPNQ